MRRHFSFFYPNDSTDTAQVECMPVRISATIHSINGYGCVSRTAHAYNFICGGSIR